jgi:hypothetical protein
MQSDTIRIRRRGNAHDVGDTFIEFVTPQFAWRKGCSCFTIEQVYVKDFSADSRHNYEVSLPLAAVQSLLGALSDAAISDPTSSKTDLRSSLTVVRTLIRQLTKLEASFDVALEGKSRDPAARRRTRRPPLQAARRRKDVQRPS